MCIACYSQSIYCCLPEKSLSPTPKREPIRRQLQLILLTIECTESLNALSHRLLTNTDKLCDDHSTIPLIVEYSHTRTRTSLCKSMWDDDDGDVPTSPMASNKDAAKLAPQKSTRLSQFDQIEA